jgi:hypothetical protein
MNDREASMRRSSGQENDREVHDKVFVDDFRPGAFPRRFGSSIRPTRSQQRVPGACEDL